MMTQCIAMIRIVMIVPDEHADDDAMIRIVMTDMAKPEQESPVTMRGRMRKRRG